MRNKDYLLKFENGSAVAAEGNGNAVANRIYTALTVKKGTLISDYEWGSEIHNVKKDAPSAPLTAKRYCERALDKISDLQQVLVDVKSENRLLKINIKAQINGQYLTENINI